jgi:hypothetical protein
VRVDVCASKANDCTPNDMPLFFAAEGGRGRAWKYSLAVVGVRCRCRCRCCVDVADRGPNQGGDSNASELPLGLTMA